MPPQRSPKFNPYRSNRVGSVAFTIGAQVSRTRTISIQLKDERFANVAVRAGVRVFLSDDANGDSITAVAADGGIAAGTNGWVLSIVAGKMAYTVSEANGTLDVAITHSATRTHYLGVVLPDGGIQMSSAVAFS